MLDAAYAAAASKTRLCVSLQRYQVSVDRGHAAQWIVSAWTENGNVPDATVRLEASPTSQVPEFSFGCGSYDSSASCNLGAVYSGSTPRQVIARITVPAADTTVSSVQLTAIALANLVEEPSVSVSVTVDKATVPTSSSQGTGSDPSTSLSPLPVGSLPAVGSSDSTSSLSPGGNASSLFPTINPSAVPSPGAALNAAARPVADAVALPIGTPVIDGQLVGLGALGVAFLLAVTRLSVRRRPALAGAAAGTTPAASAPPAPIAPATTESAATESAATVPPTRVDFAMQPESLALDEPFTESEPLTSEPPTRPDPVISDVDDD